MHRLLARPLQNGEEISGVLGRWQLLRRKRVGLEESVHQRKGGIEGRERLQGGFAAAPLTPAKRSSARHNQSPAKFLSEMPTQRGLCEMGMSRTIFRAVSSQVISPRTFAALPTWAKLNCMGSRLGEIGTPRPMNRLDEDPVGQGASNGCF